MARGKTEAMSAVAADGVRKVYADGGVVALDDVSLRVADGEVVGLLGPNGAGKTTLIEILLGLRDADAGTIDVFGTPAGSRDARRVVGCVLQSMAFPKDLRLAEVIRLFGALHGVRADPGALLETVRLGDKVRQKVDQLSGGQARRFALAVATIHRPRLLVLDEPSAGLDPQARVHFWELLGELNRNGVTVLLSTHSMEEAEQLCSRVAIIDRGQILADGPIAALLDDPALPRTVTVTSDGADDRVALRAAIASADADVVFTYDARTTLRLQTRRSSAVVAAAAGVVGVRAELEARTLEDVFFERTGRRLRE